MVRAQGSDDPIIQGYSPNGAAVPKEQRARRYPAASLLPPPPDDAGDSLLHPQYLAAATLVVRHFAPVTHLAQTQKTRLRARVRARQWHSENLMSEIRQSFRDISAPRAPVVGQPCPGLSGRDGNMRPRRCQVHVQGNSQAPALRVRDYRMIHRQHQAMGGGLMGSAFHSSPRFPRRTAAGAPYRKPKHPRHPIPHFVKYKWRRTASHWGHRM